MMESSGSYENVGTLTPSYTASHPARQYLHVQHRQIRTSQTPHVTHFAAVQCWEQVTARATL